MSWYYVEDKNRIGPVTDAELDDLVMAGKITPETLVWRDGMVDWQPYKSVAVKAASEVAPMPSGVAAVPGHAACVQCGRSFTQSEMVSYEGSWVCASCKETFFQKIREGASSLTSRVYGGFWIRFCAKFIDGLLLWVVNTVSGLLVGMLFRGAAAIPVRALLFLLPLAVGAAYTTYFLGTYGATLGKMACHLKVVTAEGDPVTYGRALGRHFAEMLSGLILFIGYLMIIPDAEKRALHDRICNTRVVKI